jgi:hypothetical protein
MVVVEEDHDDADLAPFASALVAPTDEDRSAQFVLQGFAPPAAVAATAPMGTQAVDASAASAQVADRDSHGPSAGVGGASAAEVAGELHGRPFSACDANKASKAGFDVGELVKLCSMLGIRNESGVVAAEDEQEGEEEGGGAQRGLGGVSAAAQAPGARSGTGSGSGTVLFAAGDVVELFGLTGAVQHNGKRGVVRRYCAAKGRFAVEVQGAERPVLVRGANLRRCIDTVHADIADLKAEIDARAWPGASSELGTVEAALALAADHPDPSAAAASAR